MFKAGDKVKINPESRYFNVRNQLPYGVVGIVRRDQEDSDSWVSVSWDGGMNVYPKEDLIKVATFKGNK